MTKWDKVVAAVVWGTFAATFATAILLFYVWRETRMVLQMLNGGCLP